jgi:hypothetical protein
MLIFEPRAGKRTDTRSWLIEETVHWEPHKGKRPKIHHLKVGSMNENIPNHQCPMITKKAS